ncbi:MAG: hypothetical protein Q9M34_09605 [Sulfurimonas sp.]|nr:hypothetical protein [Sulfurimonas sp.]
MVKLFIIITFFIFTNLFGNDFGITNILEVTADSNTSDSIDFLSIGEQKMKQLIIQESSLDF